MIQDVQQRIVKFTNELKAQKVYSGLTYSQLLLPERSPTLSYSGIANLSGSGLVARLRFRFTRTDGLIEPPFINFAYSFSILPTYKEFAQSNGFIFSADDLTYIDRSSVAGYISEIGDGYVDFYVDFNSELRGRYFSLESININAACQAIANIEGNLTVERLK